MSNTITNARLDWNLSKDVGRIVFEIDSNGEEHALTLTAVDFTAVASLLAIPGTATISRTSLGDTVISVKR